MKQGQSHSLFISYLATLLVVSVVGYFIGTELAKSVTTRDMEYLDWLARHDTEPGGSMPISDFLPLLYAEVRLSVLVISITLGHVAFYIYFVRSDDNRDLRSFLKWTIGYAVIGLVSGYVFSAIGSGLGWRAIDSVSISPARADSDTQTYYRIRSMTTIVGASFTVSAVLVVHYFKRRQKQKHRYNELREEYIQIRNQASIQNKIETIHIPKDLQLSVTDTKKDRVEKINELEDVKEDYRELLTTVDSTKSLYKENDIRDWDLSGDKIEDTLYKTRRAIVEGERDVNGHLDKVSNIKEDLDDVQRGNKLMSNIAENRDVRLITKLEESLNSVSLDAERDDLIQTYETLYDTILDLHDLKIEYTLSIEPIYDDLEILLEENEEISKSQTCEIKDVVNDLSNIWGFLQVNQSEYTGVDEEELRDKTNNAIECRDYDRIRELSSEIGKMQDGIWKPKHLHAFSWEEFERLVGDLLETRGYETTIGQQVSDKGIDIRGENGSETIAIQVKQYSDDNKVGAQTIRKTGGLLPRGFDRVMVITSSTFTKPAHQESKTYGGKMELINGRELVNMLNKSDLMPPGDNARIP